ncbi:MAG TPA: aspartate carbamoyltransferase catalytic subunit [Polyangiaceae bacterium]|jgi:aspartate carbamoyltransferase catalytic subunit|nr:aspartate carbamoyltransferase catalytic subunit [Polyangiaceae bacterium]
MDWTHRNLLGIAQLSRDDILHVLDGAERWFQTARDDVKNLRVLHGRTIVNIFFESSTRTRTSFEVAGKRLGADVVNVALQTSSVTKGETLLDTLRNLEALRADAIVLRHAASGAPHFVASATRTSIVNAGDGAHEHPTQALLDAFTIRRKKGRLAGLVVTISGDVLHSRVARSNALLLGALGAEVRLCGPRTLMPRHAEALGPTVRAFENLDRALDGADVVMMLRIQTERLAGAMIASTREYARTFGLSARALSLAKPDAIVMHPGPINRGVEIDPRVADGPQSVILDQVEAGVAVRMAVLERVIAAGDAERGRA